jgi:HlyD family secretion protein
VKEDDRALVIPSGSGSVAVNRPDKVNDMAGNEIVSTGGKRRRGGTTFLLLGVLAAIAVGLGLVVMLGGGDDDPDAAANRTADVFRVAEGSFNITIPASGELAALHQVEIRSPIEGSAVITFIVPEGIRVHAGDTLIEFAQEELRSELKDEELEVLEAEKELAAAHSAVLIQEMENASLLSQAEVDVRLAELALEQWEKGEYEATKKELELQVETTRQNRDRVREKYQQSILLAEKGFISKDELKQDEIELIELEANLVIAELDLQTYLEYQVQIDRAEKESAVARAKEELERVKQQNQAELESALGDQETAGEQLAIRQERRDDDARQLERSIVTAPQDGMVVYASSLQSSGWRGESNQPPQIGTEVRQNDLIMLLPDVSQMIASVMVHESLSGRIAPGQRATVVADALTARSIRGTVLSIGVLAQTGNNWRDPNRRDYTVKILLEDVTDLGLKPSMRCRAEILLDRVTDAVYVPIQAVHHQGPQSYVYVRQGSGYAQRAVKIGRSSELNWEILEGVEPGERVLLREPEPAEVVFKLDLPDVEPDSMDSQGAEADALAGAAAPTPPGAGGGGGAGPAGGRQMDPASMIARMDANSDGSLQKSEVPAQMQAIFDAIDKDADGSITSQEMSAMAAAPAGSGGGGRPASANQTSREDADRDDDDDDDDERSGGAGSDRGGAAERPSRLEEQQEARREQQQEEGTGDEAGRYRRQRGDEDDGEGERSRDGDGQDGGAETSEGGADSKPADAPPGKP